MKQPNVVFIISDDQGFWSLGCAGNREIYTPNIDRLAAQGMRFENFFCVSPVCSPARASLLTGCIPSQHGVHDWLRDDDERRASIEYLAGQYSYTKALAESGYECALSGKWHMGASARGPAGLYALVLPQIRRRALLWGAPVPGWCIISGRALCHRCYHR